MKRNRNLLFSLVLCFAASGLQAQALKSGEFRINQRTAGSQGASDVATAADGHFVVLWQDGSADPAKPVETKVRIFDAAGKPRGGEILVDRHKQPVYPGQAVAMAPDGRFVVVWGGGKENPELAFGRRYAANGRPLGPRFPLSKKGGYQEAPNVAMAADGSFVAVWVEPGVREDPTDPDEVALDIVFRRFGADGKPLGPEAVALGGYEEQSDPQVAIRADGSFIIAGNDYGGESSFYDIDARLFSPTGIPLGDSFQVNDGPNRLVTQHEPSLAVAADGRFAIAWTDWNGDFGEDPSLQTPDDYTGVAIRFFAVDGTPLGSERAVNVYRPGAQRGPAVGALQTGGFLMLWTSGAGQDGDAEGIFGRVFGANGTPRGREFRVNLKRTGSQVGPVLSVAPNGKGAAVWSGPDGDGFGVFARLIGKPGQGS